MSRHNRHNFVRISCLVWAIAFVISSESVGADSAKVQAAIAKAQGFLLKQRLAGPTGSMAAVAVIKSGGDKKAAAIQQVTNEVLQKFSTGRYVPIQHHIYEAAVDGMLLEAIDDKVYKPEIAATAAYLIENQQSNGAWFYPNYIEPDCGDTSITQYAVLGLWAAIRTGTMIPTDVLEKTALWHIKTQRPDGGFSYHPFVPKVPVAPEDSEFSLGTMTAAASSSLLIIRRILFGDVSLDFDVKPVDTTKKFGVLERLVEERTKVKTDVTLRVSQIDGALKRSTRWMASDGARQVEKSIRQTGWFSYRHYCVERVAALMDVDELGGRDWYDEGASEFLVRQAADGSWTDNATTPATTGLALMFLSKATTTIVKPKPRVNFLGGGLQAGGRGLPDNLDSVQVKEGSVSARKIVGPVDNLLIELERSSDAKVQDIQAAVVEAVQLERPEELIGQIKRLRKLASDSRLEVRRTAIWALGRSGDVSAAPSLIQALSDRDNSVVREASLALCILSRRPEGCGKAIDPSDDSQLGLKEDATDDERAAVTEKWRRESIKLWTDWYVKNRSYDERDDRTSLKKTNK